MKLHNPWRKAKGLVFDHAQENLSRAVGSTIQIDDVARTMAAFFAADTVGGNDKKSQHLENFLRSGKLEQMGFKLETPSDFFVLGQAFNVAIRLSEKASSGADKLLAKLMEEHKGHGSHEHDDFFSRMSKAPSKEKVVN